MDDADARRHDLERVERLHAPFEKLVALAIATKLHLQIFQADERFVPQTHPDSNARLIKKSFLSFLEPNILSEVSFFPTDIPLEDSALQYDRLLQKRTVPFDVCILGIGNDGHIASLFPNASTLDEKTKLSVAAHTESFAVPERLTMTFPTILSSKKIVILLKGAQKKLVLEELLSGNLLPEHFPAKFLLSHENVQIFLNA